MLAATLTSTPPSLTRQLNLIVTPVPSPLPHEALLRVLLASICGTDLEIVAGYKPLSAPLILGHEFVGKIHAYHPSVTNPPLPIHTRVVSEINCVLPTSSSHNHDDRAHDPQRTCLGIFGTPGAFAQFCCVPIENLHKVPDSVPNDVAVFCEPIAAACRIFEQICIPRRGPIAVLGAGRMGWLVSHVLSVCGAEAIVLSRGRDPIKDKNLAEELGVQTLLVQNENNDAYDVVVDCTGHSSGLTEAVRLVKPRGTVVLKSTFADGGILDMTSVVVKEVKIVGSRCGPFKVALRLMERGVVKPKILIEQVFSLKEMNKAFELAATGGYLKALLRPGE